MYIIKLFFFFGFEETRGVHVGKDDGEVTNPLVKHQWFIVDQIVKGRREKAIKMGITL